MGRRGRHRGRRATWPVPSSRTRITRRAARVVVLVAVALAVLLLVLAVLLTR